MSVIGFVTDPMNYGFMQRGLVAAILVGIVCAVMGTFVVLKGLAFIGDAVSHAAFPGPRHRVPAGDPAVHRRSHRGRPDRPGHRGRLATGGLRFDTAVGVLFAGTFALGILLFSTIKNYVSDLFSYLLGNVLGISTGDLVQIALLGVIVLAVLFVLRKEFLYPTFDPAGAAASGLPVTGLESCSSGCWG